MPTRREPADSDAFGPRREAERWAEIADSVDGLAPMTPAAVEADVVRFYDPAADLVRRATRWGHEMPDHRLGSVCRFAAGLAATEADAWESGPPDIAASAFGERRHLFADRIIHWAVPWLSAASSVDEAAHGPLDALLGLGDLLRPAPIESGGEGVVPPGHDTFGPVPAGDLDEPFLSSLWSGAVIVRADRGEERNGGRGRRRGADRAGAYRDAAARWDNYADRHPGSTALWVDLAARAARTARLLERSENA